ncbi:MAG: hypothetical protein JNK05_04130 [Myxococcales bacterium]|nr:hypothetical protein [Myxococcales bacterium]
MSKADPSLVRRALDAARQQRSQIVRGAPLPIDTAHMVGSCVSCGRIAATVLGFPDSPYAGQPGQPRFRTARELERFLKELTVKPPQMPMQTDRDNGRTCVCGAPADPREVQGLRFIHAMPGSGAEIIVEGVRGGGSLLVSSSGDPLGGSGGEFTWKVLRAPSDGAESDVSDTFDDNAIKKSFGRGLTLASLWLELLAAAKDGKETLEKVEPGYWIYAGPKADAGLQAKLDALTNDNAEMLARDLVKLGEKDPLPAGPHWGFWAFEHAEAIQKGDLRAGVVIDQSIVRKSLVDRLTALNVGVREQDGGKILQAFFMPTPDWKGDVAGWPIEVLIVSLGAGHLGWTMAETVGAAVGEAGGRAGALADFFMVAKQVRPEIEWKFEGMRAVPVRKNGTQGRPVDLLNAPFRFDPRNQQALPLLEREIKFSTDELPKGQDPTKHCPCGAKAFVAARLFPWNVVDGFNKATGGKNPFIIETYTGADNKPRAALLAVVSDDMHVQILGEEEFKSHNVNNDTIGKRLAQDLNNSLFAVDVSMHEDKDKKRALLAYGPLVASVAINDHLIAALHEACGKPLRGEAVSAQATTPNSIVLYEAGFDEDQLDKVLEMAQQADGIPPDMATPFSLEWDDVTLSAQPVGRFTNLTPNPQDQQQQQQAAPPAGAGRAPNRAR